jgi:hypothetical protein
MVMMTLTGGAERTAREFESLLARGWAEDDAGSPGVLARPIVDGARQRGGLYPV